MTGNFENRQVQVPNAAYTQVNDIFINGNDALAEFCNGTGTGTIDDPYIIENYLVNGYMGRISISNTNAHLCIRNNTVICEWGIQISRSYNVNISDNDILDAMWVNVQVRESQNIMISGNTISNSDKGIEIKSCQNVIISCNRLEDNNKGIYTDISEDILISGNTITDSKYGIDCYQSKYLYVQSNIIQRMQYDGITLKLSNSCQFSANIIEDSYQGVKLNNGNLNDSFTNNLFTRCGFYFESQDFYSVSIDSSNKVNGKPVRYYELQTGISIINEQDIGQLILVGVNNSEFRGLNLSGSGIGIFSLNSHYNTFTDIISSYNSVNGMYFSYSSFNSITLNKFEFNRIGLYVAYSQNIKIAGNLFKNNTDLGIYMDFSKYNRIYYNSFIANTKHVLVYSDNNNWDNGKIGNYWDDFLQKYPDSYHDGTVWLTEYSTSSLNRDRYPLIYAPFTQFGAPELSTPSSISSNGTITLQWNAIKEAEYYLVYRSNSEITSLESLTPIANITTTEYSENVPDGTYYYVVVAVNEFKISDISNNAEITIASGPFSDNQIDSFPLAIIGIVCLTSLIVIRKRIETNL